MNKENYEFIGDKYSDAEFALFELVEALRGYDDVDADSIKDMHERIKMMLVSFDEYYGRQFD